MATVKPMSTGEYLARNEELKAIKRPWLTLFQSIAEIFFTRKMDFTRVLIPGEFLQEDVFDNTGQFALYLFASVCASLMWPDAARTIEILPARRLRGIPGIEDYFRFVTEEVRAAMDNPKAGFTSALLEYFLDEGAFGTAGLAAFDGPDDDPNTPVVYDAWSVKQMCISDNAQGVVDSIYYEVERTVRQIVFEYSKPGDELSAEVQKAYGEKQLDDKMIVLIVLEPKVPEAGKKGRAAMRWRTVHIDVANSKRMRLGGYEDMPVAVGRLTKSISEVYGRSPAMVALPDAQTLNALTEAILIAAEKQLDPPLVVFDSGRLGGGVVDTSASALNVYDTNGRVGNEKPIQPLLTVGEFQTAKDQQTELKAKIMQAFFLDRLLDLNNKTQMTAYETSIRDRKAGEALGGLFSRQHKEVFTPTAERTFNILYRKGYLGIVKEGPGATQLAAWERVTGKKTVVVPPAVVEAIKAGLDVYEVRYISPAARFQKGEKLSGLVSALDTIIAASNVPALAGMADKIDVDETADQIVELNGAPMKMLRTEDDTLKFRAANAAERMKQQEMQNKEAASNVALKLSQARAALGTATPIPPGGLTAGEAK